MTTADFITHLQTLGISLTFAGENIRVNAPKDAFSADLRAELNRRKPEILSLLQQRIAPPGNRDASIPVVPRNAPLPASFSQQRLWLIDQLDPGNPAYNVPYAWKFQGALDIATLEKALQGIARRHEVLRTTFEDGPDHLLQIVHDEISVPLRLADLSAAPEADRESQLQALLLREVGHRFDLATGPLLRALLVRLSEQEHLFLLNLHHIVCDEWSIGLIGQELGALYRALTESQSAALPEISIQYADFAAWQREQLKTPEWQKQLAFWKSRLGAKITPLTLPADRPRSAVHSFRGSTERISVSPAMTVALENLGRKSAASPFMTFLAAFLVFLHRYTREEDIVVGTPIANRSRDELQPLIGFFLNTLALRADLSGDPTFVQVLERVRDAAIEGYENQDFPFEMVVKNLRLERVGNRNPLFQTVFVHHTGETTQLALPGLQTESWALPGNTAKFDLACFCTRLAEGMTIGFEFSHDLFEPNTIQRMLRHLAHLLEEIARDPQQRLSELPIMDAAERRQLEAWDGRDRIRPITESVTDLFRKVVARVPGKIAIDNLTYRELDERSTAIAQSLIAGKLPPGSLIGLRAERSARFVAGILGILKAGCAYVPLNPDEPAERIERIQRNCQHVLDLEADYPLQAAPSPEIITAPDAPAYVLYTSGSTGEPKGVVIPHSGIVRLVIENDYAPFAENDVVAFASNVCFDAATFEIWGAQLNGATLVVTPHETLLSPEALSAHLTRHRVSVLFLTTSLFNRLAHESPAMFRGLRHLVFGGEAADAASVRLILEHGKPERLVNGYGPTETTTFAVCQQVERVENASVPIGKPIANTQVLILDPTGNLVPIGVPGEIHIGGPGVALGYWKAPELTAARFLTTPFGRVYKTGDLAKWNAAGEIEYLGRVDEQIKLRGFRIEPGEIVAALQQHPGVSQAAVCARDFAEEKKLVGYLVRNGCAAPADVEVREFLQRRLPAHMIPQHFLWLDALPLTPNGKLDQRALPEPALATPAAAQNAHHGRNPIEHAIAEEWIRVLGRNGFSMQDDFFRVGGHSLLAIQLLGRIRERFGVPVPARRLFETPTVEGLSEYVARHIPAPAPAATLHSLVAIQAGDTANRPLFFVPGGWGGETEFLVYAKLKLHLPPELPLFGLKARGADGVETPHATVEEMVAAYISEIRTRQPHGPYRIAGECVGGIIAIEMARALEKQGEEVELLLLLDTSVPSRALLRDFQRNDRREMWERFWETRIAQPALGHREKLARLSFGKKIWYIWTRVFRRSRKDAKAHRTPAPVEERKVLAHYPRLLMAHPLQPYAGRITLLADETSHAEGLVDEWKKLATGGLDVHVVPGDHISYIRDHAATAAAKLREILERFQTHTLV